MKLFRLEKWYNPFGIEVSGHIYALDAIVAFDENGEVAVNHSGWWGSNNQSNGFVIDCDCVCKRKIDYSLKSAFVISFGERDFAGYKRCKLYIPANVLDLKKSVVRKGKYIYINNQSSIYKDVLFTKMISIDAKATPVMRQIKDLGNDIRLAFDINEIEGKISEMQCLINRYKEEMKRVENLSTEELLEEFNK